MQRSSCFLNSEAICYMLLHFEIHQQVQILSLTSRLIGLIWDNILKGVQYKLSIHFILIIIGICSLVHECNYGKLN